MERQHNHRKEIHVIKSRCKFTCGQANLSEHVFSMRQIVLEVKRLAGAFLPKSNLVTGRAPYFKDGHDVKLGGAKVSINMLLAKGHETAEQLFQKTVQVAGDRNRILSSNSDQW